MGKLRDLSIIFEPKSIAVIGATSNPRSVTNVTFLQQLLDGDLVLEAAEALLPAGDTGLLHLRPGRQGCLPGRRLL